MRSPAESSMSSSRRSGFGETCFASAEQLVGGLAHRGDDDDDVVAEALACASPARRPAGAADVGDARAAVLLDDDGHRSAIQQLQNCRMTGLQKERIKVNGSLEG